MITLLIVGVIAFFFFDLVQFLNLDSLKKNKDALRHYTETHYPFSVFLFVLIYCTQTALSLPGAAILTLTGGFLFGTMLGTLYANIGATSGAMLAFLSARYLFRDVVERKFGKRLESIQAGFVKDAFHYLLTLRLIPVFPFFLINLACGLTRIRLTTFMSATALGIIPGSFVYANTGKQLGTINSIQEIASPNVLAAFVLLGLLSLFPVIYKRIKGEPVPQTQDLEK